MLNTGTRLGPYEIVAPLGAGGMGEVYRARDTKLNRDVAIKVLLPAVANDPDRLARFSLEAQVLASLNHPNIAHIHGIEESSGVTALVMELVEGEDLSQRIARGAIPLDEAWPIARQIAEAVEAAHEQGIIHRDLKPANIKVRPDGTVKVLDFGLAKALEPTAASSATAANSPTLSLHATQAGMILGTAAYMAPEQARGRPVDKRADVWAFGAVLYEMLTGARAFAGEDITDTIVAVMSKEPDWGRLPAGTPSRVRGLIRRCLEKDVKRRLQAIGEARIHLGDLVSGARDPGADEALPTRATATPSSSRGTRLAWVVAAVALLAAAGLAVPAVRYLREAPPAAPPATRTEITTPVGGDPLSFALSPDGTQIVFVAAGDGAPRLWLRSLSTTTAQPLAGTEGAAYPFWSPDSRSVAFFADGQLKRLDLGGGAPRALAAAPDGRSGSWNTDGVVLFAPNSGSPLFRVAAAGGNAAPVTTLDRQASHRWPVFLPDGRHFVFYAQGGPDTRGIHLGTLDAGASTRLTAADTAGTYLPAGAGRDGGWAAVDPRRHPPGPAPRPLPPGAHRRPGPAGRCSRVRREFQPQRGGGLSDGRGGLPRRPRQPAAADLGRPDRKGPGHPGRAG
ncbi:MAG TPA: protein kinase [Vicinamibacterales bacterium]|nr:protein kinase [Vicinamibacterales bacterium]